MKKRTNAAYDAALELLRSSTSGWTWDKAVEQVTIAFKLSREEVEEIRTANLARRVELYKDENVNFLAELKR